MSHQHDDYMLKQPVTDATLRPLGDLLRLSRLLLMDCPKRWFESNFKLARAFSFKAFGAEACHLVMGN